MTITFSEDFQSIYYLPAWVVHPTIIGTDEFLVHRKPAEQAGRAKGWRPAQAGREGILQQHDGIARSAINVCCLQCEALQPMSDNDFDNDLINNDITSNNDINNDFSKWPDNLKDGTEDANHNGRIDGDNGDGIKQDTETWEETNPNNQHSDSDTINDYWERQFGYNPTNPDTDSDGLLDSEEDSDEDGELDSTETDPKEMDTDGDGLTDTQEIDGWTVVITYEATREVKERNKITSDPRDTDSDNDGMNDYEEFTNATDPNKSDSDGDGKTDIQEISGDFNSSATGIDGTPPEIWHFECEYQQDYEEFFFIKLPSGGLSVIVEVGIKDLFGLDHINVDIRGLQDKLIHCHGSQNVTKTFEWSIDSPGEYKRVLFKGFQINVSAKDINGNLGFKESELPSIKDTIIELLGPLIEILEFIVELASSIFSWIYGLIEEMVMTLISNIEAILNSIMQRAMNFVEPLVNFIRNGFDNLTLLREGIWKIVDIIFNPIPYLLGITLMVTLAVIHCIVTGVSFGAADVIMIGVQSHLLGNFS